MRVFIAAIGRLKKGPEHDLVARYSDRISKSGKAVGITALQSIELNESRAAQGEQRKREEATSLKEKLPEDTVVIAFDERGATPDSRTFAAWVEKNLDSGTQNLAFVIGGPDGIDPEYRSKAAKVVSFGALTMPHQLARVLALEQVYRAITILTNHPYHRD